MTFGRLLLLLAVAVAPVGCSDRRPAASHLAVRSLAACPEGKVWEERKKVIAFGRYALPDVEQEFQSSDDVGRRRLADVLGRIGDPEAIPFLRIVARVDDDPRVRQEARESLKQLQLQHQHHRR